jgi:hypothetical protein
LIIKPFSHNCPVRQSGQSAANNSSAPQLSLHYGLTTAILLSTGVHCLAGFLFWYACQRDSPDERGGVGIIDTRVKEATLEVDVCLRLLDSPVPAPTKARQALVSVPAHGANAPHSELVPVREVRKNSLATTEPKVQELVGVGSSQRSFAKSELGSSRYSGGSPQGRGMKNGPAKFFQIEAPAQRIVYVIDRSVSMGPHGKLVCAKDELLSSQGQLPAETEFQIILFNRSVEVFTTGQGTSLMPATRENKARGAKFLKPVLPEGGTQPVPALKRALALKPDVIFFLTDAEDMNEREIREITILNRGRTAIHVVTFGYGVNGNQSSPLSVLAQCNHGVCRAVSMTLEPRASMRGN